MTLAATHANQTTTATTAYAMMPDLELMFIESAH